MPEGCDKTAAMGYWPGQDLPFYRGLARTFPLADRWFSSCLGPTFPNRRFLLAGAANGRIDERPFNLLDRRPARRRPARVPPLPAVPAPPEPAPSVLARPSAEPDQRRVQAGSPVHVGHLPAGDGPLHGPRPQHRTV